MTTPIDEMLHRQPWKLNEMGLVGALTPIPPAFTITLQFEGEARIHGASACNRYFATYHFDGTHVRFQQIGATRMMCEVAAMALENEYFVALGGVETYELQADRLTLYYDQGRRLLLFRPSMEG